MSGSKPEPDCTGRCRSLVHGRAVVSALTCRRTSEAAMVAYMRSTCANYCQVGDTDGRSALHMAAACGCNSVVRWLAQHKECNINAKDGESGYTPLHRSLFYGQIHVAASLIQLGASLTAVDNDGLTAIEHAMLDRLPMVDFSLNNPCEVYVWGTNANYSLGTGNQHNRQLPELLETFRKQNISIKQVSMHKFHSVFVSHNGQAFSCGHGQGGRLGLCTEQAVLTPQPVKLGTTPTPGGGTAPESCVAASVSRDHTVLLSDGGNVYTCGLNAHHQLGVTPPPPHALGPVLVPARGLKAVGGVAGVCAARFHTVVWGPKAVVTFGLHAGQLGHPRGTEKTVVKPKVVAAFNLKECCITQVSSSDGAVVVATDKGQVFLLHEYDCRRIASRLKDVVKVTVVGGHLDPRLDKDTLMDRGGELLQVLVLTAEGRLLLWQEASGQFNRCVFTLNRLLLLRDVAMTHHQLLLVSRDGEAFVGEIKPKKEKKAATPKRPAVSRLTEKPELEVIKVTKLPHAHRAVSVATDVKGRNYALIQTHPKQALFDVPQLVTTTMREQMANLLLEANEDDTIHDVIFQVGFRSFAAHQFVITSRNEHLGKLIAEQVADRGSKSGAVKVRLDNVEPELFQQFLQYIYTSECDMMALGQCPITRPESNNESFDDRGVQVQPIEEHQSNVSAFAVYSSENKKTKKSKPQTVKSPVVTNDWDPIKVIQKTASRLKMTDLCHELDGFAYIDGYIVPRGKHRVAALPCWDRRLHGQLCDVTIVSEDKRELRAHKCILAARLDYFHSMLSRGWSETSTNTLKLALPFNILEVLVDFLYRDEATSEIRDSEDLDLLSNLLVVADQLFVQRLKEQCEVSLVNVLTLKNVAELLQLAETYNATQLRNCCMQYVCLNLSAVLEARTLEGLDPELLASLSRYYLALNPEVHKRTITPYSRAPSVSTLEAALEAYPFEFGAQHGDSNDNATKKEARQQIIKKKTRVRKNSNDGAKSVVRGRNESISSIASDDADNCVEPFSFEGLSEKTAADKYSTTSFKENIDKNSQWVKIANSSKQQKVVQARLKAINAAKDPSFIVESSRESFTKLSRSSPSPTLQTVPGTVIVSNRVTSSPPVEITLEAKVLPVAVKKVIPSDFPELCSTPNSYHSFSNHQKNDKSMPKLETKKIVKVSQKQRKRLTSVNDLGLMADHLDALNQSPTPPPAPAPAPAWGRKSPEGPDNGSLSLMDIIRQEMKQVRLTPMLDIKPKPPPPVENQNKPVAGNPWGKVASPDVSPVIPKVKPAVSFTQIIADEKKQKDNLTKMLAKPLELTQIEDQAISDLLQFYNAAGATEERITVLRGNTGPVAVPTWITNH